MILRAEMVKNRKTTPVNTKGTPPADSSRSDSLRSDSSRHDLDAFLAQVRARPPVENTDASGRLIFAMDATMSRQPTWDRACHLQAEMFSETAKIGGLAVQLVYFRGFRECRASKWVDNAQGLADLMAKVDCRGGHTQIGRVLSHIKKEAQKARVNAVVYVGDCMEENIDALCAIAGELGLLGVPVFLFQEGREPIAESAFRELARLTGGAYCRFDVNSAQQLRALLSAVAVYAAGGRKALTELGGDAKGAAKLLLEQLS